MMCNIPVEGLIELSLFDSNGNICYCFPNEKNGWKRDTNKFENESLCLAFEIVIEENKDEMRVEVPIEKLQEWGETRFRSIAIFPGLLGGAEGDHNSLLIPCDSGILCHTRDKQCAEYTIPGFFWRDWQRALVNMMLIGILSDEEESTAAIIDDGKFWVEFRVRTNFGPDHNYSIDPVFNLREQKEHGLIQESPAVIYKKFRGKTAEIARWYRNYLMTSQKLQTLEQKAADNPNIDYATRAICMRMRMAAKPVPSPIPEQTTDNQPPLKVFMTFDNVMAVADECARQDVGPLDFTYVGWNYGGHDGAFPQLFPVEPAIGGESGMIKATGHLQSLGYHVGAHDNYIDSYSLADSFNRGDVMKDADGREVLGEKWGGGQAYICCPKRAAEHHVPRNFGQMERFGLDGAYYVDVISLINMRECTDPAHPVSRAGNAMYYKKILRMQHELTGVSMSEGSRDWSLPELDRTYSVGNSSDIQDDLPYADEEIPLYQMTFHGLLIYNSFRSGINAMPEDEIYLRNIAYGGTVLLYFHHLFTPFCTPENGWKADLTFETPEKLREDVTRIKRISDDMARLSHLRYDFIRDFSRLSPSLSETVYENGSKVYVNYGSIEIIHNGHKIPPKDFIVI